MKITADTNVLVRALLGDHARQSKAAKSMLRRAETVALTLPALCELIWVLEQGYKIPSAQIGSAIRRLLDAANVVVDRPAAEAGLALLDAGGDFADGVIAHEGSWLGSDCFVSFDKEAVSLLRAQGLTARLVA